MPLIAQLRESLPRQLNTGSAFLAARFGLVALIARGYRWFSYRLWRGRGIPQVLSTGVRNPALTRGDDYV